MTILRWVIIQLVGTVNIPVDYTLSEWKVVGMLRVRRWCCWSEGNLLLNQEPNRKLTSWMNLRYPVNTKGLLLKLPIEDFQYLYVKRLNRSLWKQKVPIHEKLYWGWGCEWIYTLDRFDTLFTQIVDEYQMGLIFY